MRLYHGSNVEIEVIDLNRGRRGKDFGRGFYANPDYKQAVEFCSNVVRREGQGVPTVTNILENYDTRRTTISYRDSL